MAVLTKQEIELLDRLSESQPALQKVGVPLSPASGVALGSLMAALPQHIVAEWDFAKQGGTEDVLIQIGSVPAGHIIQTIITDELTAVTGNTDAEIILGASTSLVGSIDFTASAGLQTQTLTALVKTGATAQPLSLRLNTDAALTGKVRIHLICLQA